MKKLAAALLLIAPAAHADIAVGAFDPVPSTIRGGFQLESPDVGSSGNWSAGSVFSFAKDVLVIDAIAGDTTTSDTAIATRWMANVGGSFAFLDRFEAGLTVPVYLQSGDGAAPAGTFELGDASGGAFGDIGLHVKARLAKQLKFTAGAALHLTMPTSTEGQYTGVDKPSARVLGLGQFHVNERVSLLASVGGVIRAPSSATESMSITQGSAFAFGAGGTVRLLDRFWMGAEIFGELAGTRSVNGSSAHVSPIEALLGAAYRGEHLAVGLAIGRGLSSGMGAPELRTVLSITYVGKPFKPAPLTRSTVEDVPADADGDGILADDKCPNGPEDRDEFEDTDGCPDPDNDGDQIADVSDKCPLEAESKNGVDDEDGCPDKDTTTITTEVVGVGGSAKAAQQAFEEGRRLMKENKFAEACTAFEQSQRLDPAFGTQYNLAGCYDKLGKLASAHSLYRVLAKTDTNAERKGRADAAAQRIAPRIPQLKIVVVGSPPNARVTLNNESAIVGVETPVDLGAYVLAVEAPGFKSYKRNIEIREEGKLTTISVDLEKAP